MIVSPELFRGNRAVDVLRRAEQTGAPVYAVSPRVAARISDRDSSDGLAAIAMSRQWQLADLVPRGEILAWCSCSTGSR